MTTLLDLGERNILSTILPRFTEGIGDDCAILDISQGQLVVTTDPVPPPAAAAIGRDDDPFWMGWLLVTINVSDLAAAGARPLGFVAAVEAESSRTAESFERLLAGIKASCSQANIKYVGGNIREASKLSAVGTAFGICNSYSALTRSGAHDGDKIVSIGAGGTFWRDAFRLLEGQNLASKELSNVFKPSSQIRYMHDFARRGLIKAAMDNSDGLLPTLVELGKKNGVGVEIDITRMSVPGLTESESDNAPRYWLGWGDWNVIACVSDSNYEAFVRAADVNGASIHEIGRVTSRHSEVLLKRGDASIVAPRLESERFASDSWMTKGISEYVRLIKSVPLP